MLLEKGTTAPDFEAKINGDKTIKLSDYRGKKVILYFYPKDNTSGCTKESCEFRDNFDLIADKNTVILGVSPDSVKSHEGFIEKQSLNFDLISDPDKEITQLYGAWGEKNMYGRKFMGLIRSTYLIDEEGIIKETWYKVRVTDHVKKVLKAID